MTSLTNEVKNYVHSLAHSARRASKQLATAQSGQKNRALVAAATRIRRDAEKIIAANKADIQQATEAGRDQAFLDRLLLDETRIEAIAASLEEVAELPDPVGRLLAQFERPNGLTIDRVAVPIGVVGMIFESRPNVAADASGLCIKSGNAIVLRGGSESLHSTAAIVKCMRGGLEDAGLSPDLVQLIDTRDRAAVKHLLQCSDFVDLIIPRGGKGLVQLVRGEARVPTLEHLDGNCHTYIHAAADVDKAVAIVKNAKLRRTGICGATESLVIDKFIAPKVLPALLDAMPDCEFRGDSFSRDIDARIVAASADDYATEYLDAILSVKLVDNIAEAIDTVEAYSSHHTDAIITEDQTVAETFMAAIDSAVVVHNASTQFSDGGEFGMGAEIGIATGKMHARGPVGLEQLTTFKYKVRGSGQIRP